MENAKYIAQTIAQWFINRNAFLAHIDRGDYITDLKLQKMLYYAQGVYLGLFSKPLFDDKIFAWKLGPVVENVYNIYSKYRKDPIKETENVDIDDNISIFLEKIQEAYGKYSAFALVDKTHKEKPYRITPINCEISISIIKEFFKAENLAKFEKKLSVDKEEEFISFNLLNKNLAAYKRLAK